MLTTTCNQQAQGCDSIISSESSNVRNRRKKKKKKKEANETELGERADSSWKNPESRERRQRERSYHPEIVGMHGGSPMRLFDLPTSRRTSCLSAMTTRNWNTWGERTGANSRSLAPRSVKLIARRITAETRNRSARARNIESGFQISSPRYGSYGIPLFNMNHAEGEGHGGKGERQIVFSSQTGKAGPSSCPRSPPPPSPRWGIFRGALQLLLETRIRADPRRENIGDTSDEHRVNWQRNRHRGIRVRYQ